MIIMTVFFDSCHPRQRASFPRLTVYLNLILKIREAEQIVYVAQTDPNEEGMAIMINKQSVDLVLTYGRITTPYTLHTEL